MTGTSTRLNTVELAMPPMMTTAIGARDSPPASSFMASGIIAKTIVAVVIKIGRRRV